MTAPLCPACKSIMEVGFTLDHGHFDSPKVARWAEGEPKPSFWHGLALKGKERLAIVTYRCPRCGLLQSYAPETAE